MGKKHFLKKQTNKQTNKNRQTAFGNQMEYNLIMFDLTLTATNSIRFRNVILHINCYKDC